MRVTKEIPGGVDPGDSQLLTELAEVNRFSKTPLTSDQAYLFGVRLCDNQVDRDDEYFDRNGLETLAKLFVGKTGIFDHAWRAKNQAARIYRTEIVPEAGTCTETGEPSCYLKGYAYMLRTEENAGLIADIEGGIKKEVSVSCAVTRAVCSLCGNDINDRSRCSHVKGRVYEGKRCAARLEGPTDAYEWSFVAVPAQRSAGVVKGLGQTGVETSLRQLMEELPQGVWSEQLRQMEREAVYGRRYLAQLGRETVRLGLMAQVGLDKDSLEKMVGKLEPEDLEHLKKSYEETLESRFPPTPQLGYGARQKCRVETEDENSVFVI